LTCTELTKKRCGKEILEGNMITISNLRKSYKKKEVIKSSSFEISQNTISFLMGENGAGKTTLLKCLMAMEHFEGEILFDGKSIEDIRANCIVLWDDCPFYNNLSGFHNLLIFSEGKLAREKIKEVASVHLDSELLRRKVATYSYGQRKILALVLVEILKPEYLFMDEISNGLDYEAMRELKKRLERMAKHMTIFLTGHQFDFYNDVVEELFIFKNKKIIREDYNPSESDLGSIYDEKIN
jgi:ABC-2 type transport system ATP-binding protein